MPNLHRYLVCAIGALTTLVGAQEIGVVRDLDAVGRVTLSKDELTQLIPGAKMSRTNAKGNTHYWKNDLDGSFIISSDNRDSNSRSSTAPGKWHISEDGRYCVLIEWKKNPTEEWCRYLMKAGNEYYSTKSDKVGTEKVYKLEISK
ncbi:DUF995 domain-containing protein [Rhodoferax sp. 4810]|nr:DUF995 domain-containing protein [Rhodoferax jenense]